jgi:hypothetical protein
MQEKGVKKMPKVGDKKFDYTEKGMDAAEDYAMETGQEVIPTYDAGGRVERIQGYSRGGAVERKRDYDEKVEKYGQDSPYLRSKAFWKKYGTDFESPTEKKNREGTSRVTKPKKHKAKGKWFPSAEELKEKKESTKQKKGEKKGKKKGKKSNHG